MDREKRLTKAILDSELDVQHQQFNPDMPVTVKLTLKCVSRILELGEKQLSHWALQAPPELIEGWGQKLLQLSHKIFAVRADVDAMF